MTTLVLLALAWLAAAGLVLRPALLRRLPARSQAASALLATLALVVVPVSGSLVVLSRSLEASGRGWRGCGQLIWAIARDPLGRPEVTAAMGLVLVVVVRLGAAAIVAWRSQGHTRRLVRGRRATVLVLPFANPLAFTAGLLRPRVVVSEGLLASLDPEQAEVVVAHEEAHRRGRHPLLVFLVEALAYAFPFAPLRRGAQATRLALEAVADERAARVVGSRELVAQAIAEVALATAGAGIGFEGDAVVRVRRLLEDEPRRRIALATVAVVGLLAVVLFAAGHAAHCAARSADTFGVVQCRTPPQHE